jgi:hypothetical protein
VSTYYLDEAAFTLPDLGFVDRTLHRLESPLPDADGASDDPLGVEIRRLPIERGKRLRELVDGDIASTRAKVNGFMVLDEVSISLSGAPAILVRSRFRARDVAYCQLKAHAQLEATWLTVVVTGPYRERAACDEAFDRIVQSLQWRSG